MAILDERTELADALALNTGGAATYLLGDVIDLEIARDLGNGQPLYFCITIDTLPVSATGTINFQIATDAQAAIATDGSATVHAATGPKLAAQMPAGQMFVLPLPLEGSLYERYLGLLQITAVAAFSAGKINAFITSDPPTRWKPFLDAIN